MKKELFLLVLKVLIFGEVQAQKLEFKEVPPAVMASFSAHYSNTGFVEWAREKGQYEASFKQNGQKISVILDATGNILETEYDLNIAELPAKVRTAAEKMRPGQTITAAARLVDISGKTRYEVGFGNHDLIFDAEGNHIH